MMLYCAHMTGLNNIYKVYKSLHIYSRSTESLGIPVPESFASLSNMQLPGFERFDRLQLHWQTSLSG